FAWQLLVAAILVMPSMAYTMAQNLDPNSDGRGVLQFKTGLMSVIKQKLAKEGGVRIDRNRDIENLWEFYQRYKQQHRVDDIQREEQRLQESGTFSSTLGDSGRKGCGEIPHRLEIWPK
ncbi:callose synthase 10-like, partial [Trifolium medium]|nr:callose synthase 10-like [Trifolium medium]